ncbi:MAG: PfkB family carbohydrate kinase [Prevotellaceae bacterium]|jgi:rfaE bifunctional protein kinase chain/domain|nr:PfkB family carbohydrate kinase [Prevotellaceae bacterium]
MINFQHIFDKFDDLTVMVIGDVMVDAYLWGKVSRISPEAPVPILAGTQREHRLGGAANVALNLQALGARPVLCSAIGNDRGAEIFKSMLSANGLTQEGILADSTRVTTTKTRVIAGTQHLLRIDEETTKPLHESLEKAFFAQAEHLINSEKIDAIIFEDYDKGVITPNLIRWVVSLANVRKIPTLVDPKKRNFWEYGHVTLFKPNFQELCEGLNEEVDKKSYEAIFEAAQKINRRMSVRYAMITLSERGVLVSDGEQYSAIPAELRNIADVSGAGDTVISVASLCLAAGMAAPAAAAVANLAGGLVCEKVGVVPVNKKQLLDECVKKLA